MYVGLNIEKNQVDKNHVLQYTNTPIVYMHYITNMLCFLLGNHKYSQIQIITKEKPIRGSKIFDTIILLLYHVTCMVQCNKYTLNFHRCSIGLWTGKDPSYSRVCPWREWHLPPLNKHTLLCSYWQLVSSLNNTSSVHRYVG